MQYLHQLGLLHALRELSDRVIVPQAVVDELTAGRLLGVNVPDPFTLDWVDILTPRSVVVLPLISGLGLGEIEVLALGLEIPGTTVVLDDRLARKTAEMLGIRFTGALGILVDAKQEGLVLDVSPILDTLQDLGFWLSHRIREAVLRIVGESPN